tara:strand:- start:92265 stop:94637 length:2373 start_codon:yes stop_codon:yes gene_type:complete
MEDQIEDQELFKSIFESSAQGILVVDSHGIILRANQALEGIFGYDQGELVHAKLETLVPQETRKIHLDLQKKYSKNPHGRAMGKLDIWGLKKDGTQISLDISLNPSIVNSKKVVIAFVANNTERMQAQMSTITNEERMSEAQSIAHIGSWTWNLQTNERYWSDEFYRICGLSPGDKRLNAETVVNFIHAEDRDAALQKVSGAIENKTPYVYEKRIVTPEGALKYVLAKGKVTYDSKGKPLMMKGTMQDITEQKADQTILYTRNQALQVAGNGIVIVDARNPELPIIYCNKAFTEITGYSQEEVIGVNCQFLQNNDRDQEAIVKMAIAIKKGEASREILRNYRKDGTLFWNELSITPLYNEKNELTHFIGVQNDVTEIIESRKELENYAEKLEETIEGRTIELQATLEKLEETNLSLKDQNVSTKVAEGKARASQEMFMAIAQNFPKGVIIVFNTDFELVYVEGEELDHIDVKKSDLQGALIDDLSFFSNIQKSKLKEEIKNTFGGTAISSELAFQGQNYSVNSTPLLGDHQKVVWALFVFNNITQQKNIQQRLEVSLHTEQELNELKSRFISMASHEFRTPLSAILSSAILIGKQNESGNEERRMKHVFRIRNNVKNLVVILNDFLSLSKLEEGKVSAIPQHFELIEFSKLVIEEMEATKREGQQIRLSSDETSIVVYLDPKLLSHILINLLSNATKYSKEDQNILLEISITGTQVILTVTDEGIGIPQEEKEKLFGRFFRAANATNIQGTGLGLHIVKQYVELMGGSVSCSSEIGNGATFKVKLPLKME